jgi:hypothetical protein
MALPRAARQLVKLFPIAFVPSIHRPIQSVIPNWMRSSGLRFPSQFSWSHPKLAAQLPRKYLLVYPKPLRMKEFLGLLYQTRQPAECFGGRERTASERRRAVTRAAMNANLQRTANWRGYYTEGRGLARTNSEGL